MWTVTRQCQWPEGDNVVEISQGGLDYTNPGALVAKYEGEFEEFLDPREALKAALFIKAQWVKDTGDYSIGIAHGATLGFTMPFEVEEEEEYLHEWAEKAYKNLKKCDRCQEVMPDDEKEWFKLIDDFSVGGEEFCSENCAERAYEFMMEEQAKFDEEEENENEERN